MPPLNPSRWLSQFFPVPKSLPGGGSARTLQTTPLPLPTALGLRAPLLDTTAYQVSAPGLHSLRRVSTATTVASIMVLKTTEAKGNRQCHRGVLHLILPRSHRRVTFTPRRRPTEPLVKMDRAINFIVTQATPQ